MRVEDTMHGTTLSPFELEVKEKIASSPSAFEEWAKREEMEERNEALRATLTCLVQKAGFSPKQRACYELAFAEGLSDQEVAERLGISRGRIRWLKVQILKALRRAHERERLLREVEERAGEVREDFTRLAQKAGLSPRERSCCQMIYVEGISEPEAAKRLGVSVRRIRQLKKAIRGTLEGIHGKRRIQDLVRAHEFTTRHKLVIHLRHEERLPLKEIARRLSITVRAVQKVLSVMAGKF